MSKIKSERCQVGICNNFGLHRFAGKLRCTRCHLAFVKRIAHSSQVLAAPASSASPSPDTGSNTMRPFTKELRLLGFTPAFDSTAGGERCWQWELFTKDRLIIVQLWGGGEHRVSHERIILGDKNRRIGDTTPTGFKDVPCMLRALFYEATRTQE